MYRLLVRLLLISALAQLGMSLRDLDCHGRACVKKIEEASSKVLKIDWRPISVWPNEGRRFKVPTGSGL